MKKFLLAATVLTAIVAPQAFAQGEMSTMQAVTHASHFEGFSAALGFAALGAEAEIVERIPPYFYKTQYGQSSLVGLMDLSYTRAIDSHWLLGAGFTYDINATNAGGFSSSDASLYTLVLKLKGHASLYIKPMYAVSDSTALFVKLGYHRAKQENTNSIGSVAVIYKNKTQGLGYGAGITTLLTSNVFVQAEMQMVNYGAEKLYDNDSASIKFSTVGAVLSVGYKY